MGETEGAAVGNKLYVMAGLSPATGRPIGAVYVFDTSTNAWTTRNPMLLPAHHIMTAVLNGKIYVFGGFTSPKEFAAWQPLNNSWEYDPATDRWKALAALPTPRGAGQAVNLGDQAMRAALAGGKAQVLGDPEHLHTCSYIPDIAAGLAILGEHPDAPGKVWHLPNDPRTRTTRQLLDLAYQAAGHPRARIQRVPVLALRAFGLFKPGARETIEMLYEFDRPFVVDSFRITALGARHTPLEQAIEATLASYREGAPS